MASSSASVAPLFAALVAPALRCPCAAPGTPAALQANRNQFPKLSFVIGPPVGVATKARSPVFVAAMISANSDDVMLCAEDAHLELAHGVETVVVAVITCAFFVHHFVDDGSMV
jgi:hypothetical protein